MPAQLRVESLQRAREASDASALPSAFRERSLDQGPHSNGYPPQPDQEPPTIANAVEREIPPHDYERAERLLGERGTRGDCVLCGKDEWVRLGALRNLMAFIPGATPYGELLQAGSNVDGIGAYVFACMNCGNLRLHAAAVLDQELPKTP